MPIQRIVIAILAWAMFFPALILGQENNTLFGNISYISSSHVYAKFQNTSAIEIGDTLSVLVDGKWARSLLVVQKSTTSCVTIKLIGKPIFVGSQVQYQPIQMTETINIVDGIPTNIDTIAPNAAILMDTFQQENNLKSKKQSTSGRITLSTNASLNPGSEENYQRIRAAFSLTTKHIHATPVSFSTYVTYRHRFGIDQVETQFNDDFKVLNLSLQYAPSDKYSICLGRKINTYVTNIGSIDGLQGELELGKNIIGAFIGTRPDFADFTFNPKLPQLGIYIARNHSKKNSATYTTIAIAEQQNDFKTDRRFIYFQHSNALINNVNFFLSSEFDLFKNVHGEQSQKPIFTSLYTSIRIRARKNLSFSGSYDNRRNIIYYESYQNYIDQLLAQETRQGFRVQMTYSPIRKISFNASTFYRFQGSYSNPTKNYIAYLNFNQILRRSTSVSINYNLLQSYYFEGTILGGRINDNFFKGKLNSELNYRKINYTFYNGATQLTQNIYGCNISYKIAKLTSILLSYELTNEPTKAWHRYFVTLTQRIKN
ncbi:MAG: hypothetical protein R2774_08170 [Saprospiraceae bacterium]